MMILKGVVTGQASKKGAHRGGINRAGGLNKVGPFVERTLYDEEIFKECIKRVYI